MRNIMLLLILLVFISLFLFRYMENKRRAKAEERQEARKQKFADLIETLQKANSEPDVQGSDTTEAGQ